jgi:hypothetical protein
MDIYTSFTEDHCADEYELITQDKFDDFDDIDDCFNYNLGNDWGFYCDIESLKHIHYETIHKEILDNKNGNVATNNRVSEQLQKLINSNISDRLYKGGDNRSVMINGIIATAIMVVIFNF